MADLMTESTTADILLIAEDGVVAVESVQTEVVDSPAVSVVVETLALTEIVDATEQTDLVEVAAQGVPGPPGQSGQGGESSPSLTYTAGMLTRVDYASGHYKALTYNQAGVLVRIEYVAGSQTVISDFTYNPDGMLVSIARSAA